MNSNDCKDTEYERAYNIAESEWERIYSTLTLKEMLNIESMVQFYFISELATLTFDTAAGCWNLSLLEGFDKPLDFVFNLRDDAQRTVIEKSLEGVHLDNLLDVEKSSVRIRRKGNCYEFTIKFKGGVELNYSVELDDEVVEALFTYYPRIEKTRYTFLHMGDIAEADIYYYPVRAPRLEFEFKTQELCDSFILKGIQAQDVTGVKGQSNKEEALKAYYEEKNNV